MTNSKVILITGTSTGFGRLAALKLAGLGHRVYATMRGVQGRNAEAAQSLSQANPGMRVLEIDVTDPETIERAVAQVIDTEGKIDVLINNAGIMNIGLTEAFSHDQLHRQMDVNYFGVARMFKAVLPHMRERREGLIITVTSVAARLIFPGLVSYCSSKFAVEALAEGYRYELSRSGIDSVIIQPGPFKTEIIGNKLLPEDQVVLDGYGELASMPEQVLQGFSDFMEENKDGDCDPKLVVDDIVHLVDLPFGARPLRTVSGLDYGTRDLNQVYASAQRNVLDSMEMTHLDPNSQTVA